MALTKVSRGLVNTSIEDNGNATAITIDSSENVGIGTSSPTFSSGSFGGLHVHGSSGTSLRMTNAASGQTASDGYEILLDPTSKDTLYVNRESANQRFYTGGTERMRIDSSGRVTTPSQPHIDCHGSSSTTHTYSAGDVISHFSNRSTPVGITRNGGRFTVPVAGRYLLTATLYSYLTGLTHARFKLTRNGTVIGLAQIERAAKLDSQADETVYLHHIVHLAANDYIEIKHDGGGQMYRGYTHNSLQMMLIG